MPVQPTDTSLDKLKKAGPDVLSAGSGKKGQRDEEYPEDDAGGIENEPNQVNYGFGQDAQLNTEGERTEAQEYQADGLPRTAGYTVDNTARDTEKHDARKGRTGAV